jgi:hypothetical protein
VRRQAGVAGEPLRDRIVAPNPHFKHLLDMGGSKLQRLAQMFGVSRHREALFVVAHPADLLGIVSVTGEYL